MKQCALKGILFFHSFFSGQTMANEKLTNGGPDANGTVK